MKLVKEYIDFNRGIEPKKAMNTGLTPQEKAQHIIYFFDNDKEFLSLMAKLQQVSKMQGFKNSFEYVEKAYFGNTTDTGAKIHEEIENEINKIEKYIGEVLLKNFNINEPSLTGEFSSYYITGEPPYWTFVTQTASHFKRMTESQNFHRNIEPKDAMSVGHYADLKQRAEAIQWDWEFDQPIDEKVLDIVDYYGIPIKVSLLKTFFKHPPQDRYLAIPSTGEPYTTGPISYSTPEAALNSTKEYLNREFKDYFTQE